MPGIVTLVEIEYMIVAVMGMAIALLSKRNHTYWPSVRLLALAVGVRGVFWGAFRLSGGSAIFTEHIEVWIHIYMAIQFLLLGWAFTLVVRENRHERPVDLRGNPVERRKRGRPGRRWYDE